MLGNLGKPCRRAALWALALAPLVLAGCTSGPGGARFTLFPSGHRMLDSAKDLREAARDGPLPLPRELDKRTLPLYLVEPGDSILVQQADLTAPFQLQLPGDQPILPDGTINLGRYGLLSVAGKTTPEIEAIVTAHLKAQVKGKEFGPIVVRLVARVSKVYYVLGDVNAPGVFPLQGRETVLDGIIAAGGLTDRASRQNIILSRPTAPNSCRVVLPICYREIVQLGDTTTNYQLAPGDRIFVATRSLSDHFHRNDGCSGACQHPCPLGPVDHPVDVGPVLGAPPPGPEEVPSPPAAIKGTTHWLPSSLPDRAARQ